MPMFLQKDNTYMESPVHEWFGLSYSAYFVMPRLALEAMPYEWQERFTNLMDEASEMGVETPKYEVRRRNEKGQFIDDPWKNYRRGSAAELCEAFKGKDI